MAYTVDDVWPDGPASAPIQPDKRVIREWGGKVDRVRDRLSSTVIIHVAIGGSDAGLGTIGSPLQTIAEAQRRIFALDVGTSQAIIQLAAGTYNEAYRQSGNPPFASAGGASEPIILSGDPDDPTSTILVQGVYATGGARVAVYGIKHQPSAPGQWCLFAQGTGSRIVGGFLDFGETTGADHMMATDGGQIHITQPYTISGGALNHYHVTEWAQIIIDSMVVQITEADLTFTGQFAGVASSVLKAIGVSYDGDGLSTVHGKAYLVHYSGSIRTNQDTRNVFPGDIPGQEIAGGRLDYGSSFHVGLTSGDDDITITGGDWRLIPFDTFFLQRGGDFDTATGAWTPRSGQLSIGAQIMFNGLTAGDLIGVAIYKNGNIWKQNFRTSSAGGTDTIAISVEYDEGLGASSYQVYARAGSSGSKTIEGNAASTFFCGIQK